MTTAMVSPSPKDDPSPGWKEERLALLRQIEELKGELDRETRRASRALATYQQHALTMEIVRQQNEELDELAQELASAKEIVEERALELEERNRLLRQREEENVMLIDQLKSVVRQLSTPILQVSDGVLALPIIGDVDEERASQIMERCLDAVVSARARHVILDVTGVENVSEGTAAHFMTVAQGVRMLGADCILCGVRPAVAQAIVTLGLDMGSLVSTRNLQSALERVRRRQIAV